MESWKSNRGNRVSFEWYNETNACKVFGDVLKIYAESFARPEADDAFLSLLKDEFLEEIKCKYSEISPQFIKLLEPFSLWEILANKERLESVILKKVQTTCANIEQQTLPTKDLIEFIRTFIQDNQSNNLHEFMKSKFYNEAKKTYKKIHPEFLSWWKQLDVDVTKWNKKDLIVRFKVGEQLMDEEYFIKTFHFIIPETCSDLDQYKTFITDWILFLKKFMTKLVTYREKELYAKDPFSKYKTKPFHMIIASIGKKPVGFAIFTKPNPHEKHLALDEIKLDLICVIPSAQGEGISRKLLFSILKPLPETKTISLCASNKSAFEAYLHMGFEDRLGSIPHYKYLVELQCSGTNLNREKTKLHKKDECLVL